MGISQAVNARKAVEQNGAIPRTGWTPQDVARLGMLLALATALHTFEAQLPALPIPGAKVGLANVVSLLALYAFGLREALLIVFLRQVVGSLFMGTFLSPAFFFGLAGGLLSVGVMQTVRWLVPKASPMTTSLFGAAAHNTGQLVVAWFLTEQAAVFLYLPYLLWFAVPAGAFVGKLMESLIPYLRAAGMWLMTEDEDEPKSRGRRGEIGAAVLLAAVGAVVLVVGARTPGPAVAAGEIPVAVVRVDGNEVLRLALEGTRREHLAVRDGEMWIEVEDGAVRIAESTCNHQVCVRRGKIRSTRESIVCLPYRTVITIEGAKPEADPFGGVDAITQ